MNLPNALTVLRLILVGVFAYTFEVLKNPNASVVVFVVAGITDILDGYIARKYNLVTNFGKLMDPLADKFMLIVALICLVRADMVNFFFLLVVLAKEFITIVGSIILLKKKVIVYAKKWGKLTTVCFNFGVIASFFRDYLYNVHVLLFLMAIIFGIFTIFEYTKSFWASRNDQNKLT